MMYFCNGKKGLCDHDNECQSTCEFFDGRGGYYAEVVTNADRIRAMSDEQLAEFLCSISDCYTDKCPGEDYCSPDGNGCFAWLRQPVKDGAP